MRKHFISFCVIVVFAFFAVASTTAKFNYNAFSYANKVEDVSANGDYVELNDGTKIYGKRITWQGGFVLREQIKIDGQKYRLKEVKGYSKDDIYYLERGGDFLRRIVHGKINVYVQFKLDTKSHTGPNGEWHSTSYTKATYFSQLGYDAPLVLLDNQKTIKNLVKDCPLALEMIDIRAKELRRAMRKNRNYLNEVFETYNNGCKPVHQ